jgi:hypothetical protein
MRGGDGLADLATRAVALVRESGVTQLVEGGLVAVEALALAPDVAVPVDADSGEVRLLGALVFGCRGDAVEVLHAQPEDVPGGAGQQPGEQGGAQVADVQRTCWRRRESAWHRRQCAQCLQSPGMVP